MYLLIHPHRLLHELQEEFQSAYPYLKMVFRWKQPGKKKYSALSDEQERLLYVGDLSPIEYTGMLTMEDTSLLKDILQQIKKNHGLHVAFLHFAESGWISTAGVSYATLGELNEQGRRSFHALHNVAASPKHLF